MIKKIPPLLFLIYWSISSCSQNVQWATEVLGFSSQYEKIDYSAKQVLGVPNAIYNLDLHQMAWVPRNENNSSGEFVKVGFEQPMKIQQIVVAESLNPGSIFRITLYDTDGNKHKVYENKQVRSLFRPQRLFRHFFPLTDYYVKSLKLELKTKEVAGSNQIDAIGISSSKEPVKLQVEEVQYTQPLREPENLGNHINSSFAERLPIISPDAKTLYFARKYHPQNIGPENQDDIWVSYLQEDGYWSKAINMGIPLNNKLHNFVVAVDPTGDVLYLANDYRSTAKDAVSVSYRKGRMWLRPKTLKIENHYNNSPFVSYHMGINRDVLLMCVDRKEGMGDRDVYVSFKISEFKWSEPLNLGPEINTVGTESSVFLAADGKTIYFSSNGHPGFGGLDMFMSQRMDNSWTKWTKPLNLGSKINTPDNDYNYTIPASGDYAYFASDNSVYGMSDIYRIPLPKEVQPEPVMYINGQITGGANPPAGSKVYYKSLHGTEQEKTIQASENGEFKLVLPYGEDVILHTDVKGYFSVSETMELRNQQLKELDYDESIMPEKEENPGQYSEKRKEVEQLQIKVQRINTDINTIKTQRLKAKVEDIVQSRQKTTPVLTASKTDKEIEGLKAKYDAFLKAIEDEKARKAQAAANQKPTAMEELKKKYNANFNSDTSPKPVANKKQRDEEMEGMKKRFNKFYHNKETPPPPPEPKKDPPPPPKPPPPPPTFQEIQTTVVINLQKQLEPEVRLALIDELLPQVKRDVELDLGKEGKSYLSKAVVKSVTDKLKATIPPPTNSAPPPPSDNVKEQVKQELVKKLTPDVKKDMRLLFKEEIELELHRALEYQAKKQMVKDMETELDAKLKEQKEEEARQKELHTPGQTESPPPPPPTPTEPVFKEEKKKLSLIPVQVGQIIPMNNLFFDANKSTLKEESFSELNRVLEFLQENDKLVVEVRGHTNGWCSHVFADELSYQRSEVVHNYFVENGVDKNRIRFRGYGKTKPVATNDTLAGRKKNQRVELKILEILK